MYPFDQWYPVFESRKLRRRPAALRRFGADLVLWRDAGGAAVCMPDRCPHRGASLAAGRVRDGELECPWHGMRFASGGACTLVPCSGRGARIPAGLEAPPLPVRERHGLVWLWWGERREALPDLPWFAELPADLSRTADCSFELPYAWDRMMETNLDLHHVPIAHRRSTPGVGTLLDPYEVRVEGDCVRSAGNLRKDDGRSVEESPGFAFRAAARLPGLVLLEFGEKLQLLVGTTPVEDERSWIFARYYQRYTGLPVLRKLVSWAAIQYDLRVVQREDWRVWSGLHERHFDRRAFRLIPADGMIIEFFRLLEHAQEQPARVRSA